MNDSSNLKSVDYEGVCALPTDNIRNSSIMYDVGNGPIIFHIDNEDKIINWWDLYPKMVVPFNLYPEMIVPCEMEDNLPKR